MSVGLLSAILTGIFFGLQGTYGKMLTRKAPPLLLTWASFTYVLPYLFILLILTGIPEITWHQFLWGTATSLIINVFAWYLFFKALESASLSHTMPFTAFTPFFLIPVAYIMIGEMPGTKGIIGIILVMAGGYGIHLKSKNLLAPFKNVFYNKGTRYMLIIAFFWSISATAEKVAVLNSSQVFYAFVINALLALAYLPYVFFKRQEKFDLIKKNFKYFLILGMIVGAAFIFQFTALKYLLVSYVISFKRAGAIVSVILGIILFHEKNPLKNIFFTVLMIAGVFLISI